MSEIGVGKTWYGIGGVVIGLIVGLLLAGSGLIQLSANPNQNQSENEGITLIYHVPNGIPFTMRNSTDIIMNESTHLGMLISGGLINADNESGIQFDLSVFAHRMTLDMLLSGFNSSTISTEDFQEGIENGTFSLDNKNLTQRIGTCNATFPLLGMMLFGTSEFNISLALGFPINATIDDQYDFLDLIYEDSWSDENSTLFELEGCGTYDLYITEIIVDLDLGYGKLYYLNNGISYFIPMPLGDLE